ncbi:hypothetical protein LTR36_010711 [Oleoguttula mirabilis]|uniref:Small-subunit processome Utp12 domain-containing protein n=1 Tax=Oleoguttula mirabilis TaxID=1507867 RepID=A0AAV9JRB0_9PEZI|nr:hypothetical protein LTR36_010711 [Oleoguttula mirabilis]
MSTAKRSRRRTTEARSASPLPASKRLKTTTSSHVATKSGLGFLVDEDARAGTKLEARLTNGVPGMKTTRVDESHALVAPDTRDEDGAGKVNGTPHEIIDISSAEEESSAYESEDDGLKAAGSTAITGPNGKAVMNGHVPDSEDDGDAKIGAEDDRMEDVQEQGGVNGGEGGELEAEPSFGDMLQARHPDPIDVQASFPGNAADRSALVPTSSNRALAAPSTTSLGTVLTQALKTNDKDLLESCFQVTDLPSIRSTIQRLQSQHASTLLQRLAERIHKRPGRTSNLMVWVQWTLVTHGGYLATQPEVMKKLKALGQVVQERASGLQPLLHLKGKLDLLSAQLELRRNMQAASRAAHATDEDDEEAVLYIEGQEDDWSDDDNDVAMEDRMNGKMLEPPIPKSAGQTATPESDLSDSDDDVSHDDMPNGVAHESDDESDEGDGEEAGEGLIDEEAEETSDDDADEASSNDDADSAPESVADTEPSDDESEPEVKQPQPKHLNRKR